MKKIKILSLLMCMLLLVQAIFPSASAAQVPASTDPAVETEPLNQPTEPPEFGTVCIQNGCRTIEGMTPLAGSDRKLATAQAAFLYEVNTGTVVYSYNPDMKLAPGSLAKIVNAAVVLQHCELDDEVTCTSEIYRYPAGGIHAGLKVDEVLTVEDLLYCMLLRGANDAAIALAVHVAGNQQTFTNLMNAWVQNIGCSSTEFGNVHGLDNANSTTTAREMAKILMEAIENEDLKTILSTMYYEVAPNNKRTEEYGFRTGNYMIDRGTIEDFQDSRVKGGMASYIAAYGASLAVWATDRPEDREEQTGALTPTVAEDYMEYIGVVLGCTRTFRENGWQAISYGNFNEMTDLIKLGFGSYKVNRIVYDGMVMGQFTVGGGECNAVGKATVNIDSVVPIKAQMDNLYMSFSVTDGNLSAPIAKDQMIATVQIKYRECVMAEAEVYAMGNVQPVTNNGVTIYSNAITNNNGGSGVLSTIGTVCVILLGLAGAYLGFNSYMRNRMRARRKKRRAERRRNY